MTKNYLEYREIEDDKVSDDLKFNIIRSKHLTESIMDYVTEINDVRQRVFADNKDETQTGNLMVLAYTVNREIDKISTFLSLLRDELELME